ncbi:tetratricopeptide repeat protein [Bdellovibrionota bacterium FG-2]
MAYVRRYGKQLTLVHGSRNPETGTVEQEILFTIYSKGEALELLGRNEKNGAFHFEQLMEDEFPQVRFNWKSIRKAVEQNISHLPEVYTYREERLGGRFRKDLCAITRQLATADPQERFSAAQLIQEHRFVLEFLTDLIQWRLEAADQMKAQEKTPWPGWNDDNAFYWRAEFRGRDVPSDVEEQAEEYYRQGELAKAKAVFHFLTEAFESYAEGHNYLGLIAMDEGNLEEAALAFRKTMEVGRTLFPKRIAKASYWNVHTTRPYMRGMRNLVLVLDRQGHFDKAIALCDQLEKECGDALSANLYRAFIYLNLKRWKQAAEAARFVHQIFPGDSLLAAFAYFELGDIVQAKAMFLYGALNKPLAARICVGIKARSAPKGHPKGYEEINDHNTGVAHLLNAHAFFKSQSKQSKTFFKNHLEHPVVRNLLEKRERLTAENDSFDELQQMRNMDFAQKQASEIRL